MRVSDANIENSWNEVSSDPSGLMDRFHEDEPLVADFVSEALNGLSSEACDLGFFAALVVWRAFELGGYQVGSVTAERISTQFRAAADWLQGEESAVLLEKKIRDFRAYSEPHAMKYVIEAVLDCHEDGLDLAPEEQERLLTCLKAIVDALA